MSSYTIVMGDGRKATVEAASVSFEGSWVVFRDDEGRVFLANSKVAVVQDQLSKELETGKVTHHDDAR